MASWSAGLTPAAATGGSIHLEGTERVTVSNSLFYRTDANAVFLAAYNRNATIVDNEFAYIGMSAVVTFGTTDQDDGTVGTQPWGTVIAYNLVHEIGAYQLQSSAWFTSRSTLTRFEGNVVFNIPRAAGELEGRRRRARIALAGCWPCIALLRRSPPQ